MSVIADLAAENHSSYYHRLFLADQFPHSAFTDHAHSMLGFYIFMCTKPSHALSNWQALGVLVSLVLW